MSLPFGAAPGIHRTSIIQQHSINSESRDSGTVTNLHGLLSSSMPAVVPDDCHNYGLILEQDMMSNGFLDELLPSSDEDEDGSDVFNGCELTANAANFVITPLEYLDGRAADVRGTANPSLMSKPYWKAMIIEDMGAWWPRFSYDKQLRDCGLEPEQGEPIWCFKRWGGTRTRLPDGRIVYIGGEYGNYRDIDFYVYNGRCHSIHLHSIRARAPYEMSNTHTNPRCHCRRPTAINRTFAPHQCQIQLPIVDAGIHPPSYGIDPRHDTNLRVIIPSLHYPRASNPRDNKIPDIQRQRSHPQTSTPPPTSPTPFRKDTVSSSSAASATTTLAPACERMSTCSISAPSVSGDCQLRVGRRRRGRMGIRLSLLKARRIGRYRYS